jgi:hypothetical protein
VESFSGPSPAGLMTTIYYCKFKTPPTWRAPSHRIYIQHEQGGPVISPGAGFSFRRLLAASDPRYIALGRTHRKHCYLCCCLLIHCRRDVYPQLHNSERDAVPQKTPLATPLLLLRDVTTYAMRSSAACIRVIT